MSVLHGKKGHIACGAQVDVRLVSHLWARLSRGKVSRLCLARPIRRALPRSTGGGQASAPDIAAVLETPRGCAALPHGECLGELWHHRQPRGWAATAQGGTPCR